jgi:hypothetical protein
LWLEHFERLDVDVAVCDQVGVGLSSLVVGLILFVGGLKNGSFRKDPDHLSPIFGSER